MCAGWVRADSFINIMNGLQDIVFWDIYCGFSRCESVKFRRNSPNNKAKIYLQKVGFSDGIRYNCGDWLIV